MRNTILKLHLWVGLAAGLLLLCAGVSGALLVFEQQIDDALNPKLSKVQPRGEPLTLTQAKVALERACPNYTVVGFDIPEAADHSAGAWLEDTAGRGIAVAYNPYTGEVLGTVDDNRFTRKLHAFHTHLLAGKFGSEIVGWSSVLLSFLGISGIYLWWPRKKVGVAWSSRGAKFHYDLHNTVGIISSIVLLLFAFTGMAVHWEGPVNRWASQASHTPSRPTVPKIAAPSDRQQMMDPAQLLGIAEKTAPGARATALNLPDRAGDAALVILKYPEDRTPAGRTRIFLDPYRGAVVAATDSRKVPLAIAYTSRVNRELHTGDIYGWPTRIFASFFSLMLGVLAISGPMLWWYRWRIRSAASSRARRIAA